MEQQQLQEAVAAEAARRAVQAVEAAAPVEQASCTRHQDGEAAPRQVCAAWWSADRTRHERRPEARRQAPE
eukprot:6385545-Alexandrium_andersonii.AAC.1